MFTVQDPDKMNLLGPDELEHRDPVEVLASVLPLEDSVLLELGCGRAEMTRLLAENFPIQKIVATEVDEVQLAKNRREILHPKIEFLLGGAEKIPLERASVDNVIMLKSLHHVPIEAMDRSFEEIHRVLKPQGYLYIAEPLAKGHINEVFQFFHDEAEVRQEAFAAIKRALKRGLFSLEKEFFFKLKLKYETWPIFESKVIDATYSQHEMDEELRRKIKETFERYLEEDPEFLWQSIRVDLLKRIP